MLLECTKRASARRRRLLPANHQKLRALAACLGRKCRRYEPPWVSPTDTFQFRPRSAACSIMMQWSITTVAPAVAARWAASRRYRPIRLESRCGLGESPRLGGEPDDGDSAGGLQQPVGPR